MTKNLSSVKLRHSDTRAIRALGHLGYLGTWALRHFWHSGTQSTWTLGHLGSRSTLFIRLLRK